MRPFEDVDVLDLTQVIAGPLCTQMLGSFGAHVVKVEPLDGEANRNIQDGIQFASVNRGGKRSVSVDLKDDRGRRILRELATSADVVVESFRPGVLGRFDLDYDSVAESNEDVVYCSISGFGQDGPYSDRPAFDSVIQASSGLMSFVGYPDRDPARIGTTAIDFGTGANAAFAVAAALMERERTGEGEYIDVSLFDVAVSWLTNWFAYYDHTGDVPNRAGTTMEGIYPSDVFHAADGPLYLTVPHDGIFERLCRTIDRGDLLEDGRFRTNDDRWTHREELYDELQEAFAAKDRDSTVEELTASGVPAGPLQTVDEVSRDPQVDWREMLRRVRNPELDADTLVVKLPYRTLSGDAETSESPPRLGEHTWEVLVEHGVAGERIEKLVEAGVIRDE